MASIQRRRGPSVIGIYGLLQPLADGLKLVIKEILIPTQSTKGAFMIAPIITLSVSLFGLIFYSNTMSTLLFDCIVWFNLL
jgi:NADH-quinone oxidoreductase subunit H